MSETSLYRPKTKNHWLAWAVLLAVGMLGVARIWLFQPTEPVYKDKPLHYWLQGYALGPSTKPTNGPTSTEAAEAVRALGTNAIPALLGILVHHQSPLVRFLSKLAERFHLVKAKSRAEYEMNHEALAALSELGPAAAGASSNLTEMYDSNPDAFSRLFIVAALGSIDSPAKVAVPVLLDAISNSSAAVRINATWALGKIHADPERVVPALIPLLHDTTSYVQRNACYDLQLYGHQAIAAVPSLLQFLHDAKYNPATAPTPHQYGAGPTEIEMGPPATMIIGGSSGSFDLTNEVAEALWKIDPDAAAKAHLKQPE